MSLREYFDAVLGIAKATGKLGRAQRRQFTPNAPPMGQKTRT